MSELQCDEINDVLIVRFNHHTIIANTVIEKVGSELLSLVDRADRKLLLDFRGVNHMSSAMIAKVLLLHKNCATAKVVLKLCNIDPEIMAAFTSTGLSRVLSIHHTEADAIAAFRKKRWVFW
jgi:anti-anti-sigma factor